MSQDGGPAWADAALICPLTIHLAYGDKRLLQRHYESLTRFVAFLDNTQRDGVRGIDCAGSWPGFGDWLSINADTPKDLIGSAFYAYAHRLMSEITAVLGKTADAAKHRAKFDELAGKFRHRYLSPAGKIVAQTQTAAVLALHFDLLTPEQRKPVAEALVADIRSRGNKLSCGFVGSSYLPIVLTTEGHLDVANQLLNQKQWPSWLYAVTQGATTIWERWDGWTHDKGFQDAGMNSFNHYAYGAVGAWMYQVVAGLDTAVPGYRKLRLAPRPGGGLTHARATLRTPYGHAESSWRIDGNTLHCRFVVPPNSTAEIHSPVDASSETVAAGTHSRSYPWKA
jgi:alpha-L-rhamnosidase